MTLTHVQLGITGGIEEAPPKSKVSRASSCKGYPVMGVRRSCAGVSTFELNTKSHKATHINEKEVSKGLSKKPVSPADGAKPKTPRTPRRPSSRVAGLNTDLQNLRGFVECKQHKHTEQELRRLKQVDNQEGAKLRRSQSARTPRVVREKAIHQQFVDNDQLNSRAGLKTFDINQTSNQLRWPYFLPAQLPSSPGMNKWEAWAPSQPTGQGGRLYRSNGMM